MNTSLGPLRSYCLCVALPPVIGSRYIVGPKRSGNVHLYRLEELLESPPPSLTLLLIHGSPLRVIVSNS